MNAIELYKVWEIFNHMVEDPAFDAQTKVIMGKEMLLSLPPEMLCTVGKSSLNAISKAMKSRLSTIGIENATETEIRVPQNKSKLGRPSKRNQTAS